MRNLLIFLTKYHYFFLFVLLELIALLLLIQHNNYQRASFINSTNSVTGSVHASFASITEYFRLKEVNRQLLHENAAIRNELLSSYYRYSSASDTINDTVYKQKYRYVPAKVVNSTTHKQNNYLTLNRGTADGIKKGMGVICGDGVVGIVKDVSVNFCSVMSVLHEKVLIPSMVKKYKEPGILKWEGVDPDFALLPNIPRHLKMKKGDTICTSSSSSIFAEGTMVGTVDEIREVSGNTFYDLTIRLSTDFRTLTYVYIVNYLYKDEQEELENKSQNDQ